MGMWPGESAKPRLPRVRISLLAATNHHHAAAATSHHGGAALGLVAVLVGVAASLWFPGRAKVPVAIACYLVAAALAVWTWVPSRMWLLAGVIAGVVILVGIVVAAIVVHRRPGDPVSDGHRDIIKGIAAKYAASISVGKQVPTNTHDWATVRDHLPQVAKRIESWNACLEALTGAETALQDRLVVEVDKLTLADHRRGTVRDLVNQHVGRRASNDQLALPMTITWSEHQNTIWWASDVIPGTLWGVIDSGDPTAQQQKQEIERLADDAYGWEESKAVAKAHREQREASREAKEELSRMARLDVIRGRCPDCT